MAKKITKQYNVGDVERFKGLLSDLPDVTHERLQKNHVLDELKNDIRELIEKKGYTLEEIHEKLSTAGMTDITIADMKKISAGKSTRKPRSQSSKPSPTAGENTH